MFSQVYEPKGYLFDCVPADEFNAAASPTHLDERHADGLDRDARRTRC